MNLVILDAGYHLTQHDPDDTLTRDGQWPPDGAKQPPGQSPFAADACAPLHSRSPAAVEAAPPVPPRVRVRPQGRHSTAARVRQRPDDYRGSTVSYCRRALVAS